VICKSQMVQIFWEGESRPYQRNQLRPTLEGLRLHCRLRTELSQTVVSAPAPDSSGEASGIPLSRAILPGRSHETPAPPGFASPSNLFPAFALGWGMPMTVRRPEKRGRGGKSAAERRNSRWRRQINACLAV
jgi:hypothetical protein